MFSNTPVEKDNFLEQATKRELMRRSDVLIREAHKKLEAQIPEIVSGLAISLMKSVNLKQMGDIITIEINLKQHES